MKRIRTAKEMTDFVARQRTLGQTIGFVPTMGALHQGHFSLIERSIREQDVTVCSIFVNPTQFNQDSDLKAYPRNEESDCLAVDRLGCHAIFLPAVEEVYPAGSDPVLNIDLGGLDAPMEGAFRPGHFQGVVQVVKRLLEIIPCDALYMGQKDWQQTAVIDFMLRHFNMPVRLVRCPTQREPDGLALSSRNSRLTIENRQKAPVIYRVLKRAREWTGKKTPQQIRKLAMDFLQGSGLRPEYFEIVDPLSLKPVERWTTGIEAVACTAVWAGDVRLIDNMLLTEGG